MPEGAGETIRNGDMGPVGDRKALPSPLFGSVFAGTFYKMSENKSALDHFGSYEDNPAFASFDGFSRRAFAAFHERIADSDVEPFADLIRRMIYVAEATSVGLRLAASWALTHPSFSLCRDRYEQCVRFSWLVRQSDDREWFRYIADMYLRRSRLRNAFASSGVEMPELDDGFDKLSPEAKESFKHWDRWTVDQLARRRDELGGITGSKLDNETLLTLYDSIYRQGSSVSHYDFYSIQILGVHTAPDGSAVLAPDPRLPMATVMHCALFDMIQCGEALARLGRAAEAKHWDEEQADFWAAVRRTGIMDEAKNDTRSV